MSGKEEIVQLSKSLSKAVTENQSPSEVLDILKALIHVTVTLQILAETKVGVHVRNAQKQYKDNEIIVDAAKNLISKWKEIADAEKKAKPKESAKEDQPSATSDLEKPSIKLTLNTDVIPSSSSGSSSSLENPDQDRSGSANSSPRGAATPVSPGGGFHDMFDDAELEKCFAALPQSRKNIMDIITGHLEKDSNKSMAKFLAFNIEAALDRKFSGDNKGYTEKFRTLNFNMKRNEQLRKDIISGMCPPDVLVQLSTAQLATESLKSEREAQLKDSTMERRSDYYAIMRAEIQRSVGIDPNAGGSFTCKKCKQSKTTHYSMQTRSADEPMTVFVCCLTCGYRWRCT